MIEYDKDSIKENLTIEEVYDIVYELGGDPIFTSFGLISSTICHNRPGEGSKKLYYYENTHLFKCFTGCAETFDIFELIIKAKKIQQGIDYSLMKALFYIVYKFNISGQEKEENPRAEELNIIEKWKEEYHSSFKEEIVLPEIDKTILRRFSYPIISVWEKEGITPEVMRDNGICYYVPDDQIVIPHFDVSGRLIGLRGRTTDTVAEQYGKYRPLYINGKIYKHPLRYNLYNLNNSKANIDLAKTTIVFESEKSTLMYQSYFKKENDISVAMCGSTISDYQVNLLIKAGAQEIIFAFDRQFKEIEDEEHQKLVKTLLRLNNKYQKYIKISFIFDKEKITSYKASPIDEGTDKFLYLLKKRVTI